MKNIVLFSVLIFCLLIEGATTPTYGMKRQMEALDRGLVNREWGFHQLARIG